MHGHQLYAFVCRYRAAGLLGTQSKYVCPICLVLHEELRNFLGAWPTRNQRSAEALIKEAELLPMQQAKQEKLASQSLHLISVCFAAFDRSLLC